METQTASSQHSERQYLHTFVAGALLPLAQSTITAGAIGIGAWLIALMVFDMQDPHKPAILFFAVTWIYMLIKLQRHWLSLTQVEHIVERIIQQDINQDGVIGTPPEEPKFIRVQIDHIENGAVHVSKMFDLPASEDQLNVLANGLLNGLPFSEKQWTERSKLFSSPAFRKLKDAMWTHELIQYVSEKDPRQGITLTKDGKEFLKKFASPSPPPL